MNLTGSLNPLTRPGFIHVIMYPPKNRRAIIKLSRAKMVSILIVHPLAHGVFYCAFNNSLGYISIPPHKQRPFDFP